MMIASPCENICKYNDKFICVGCYRSKEEITKWSKSTDEEKLIILENCKRRRKEENNNYDRYA